MKSPRHIRLDRDYELIRSKFDGHPSIDVKVLEGSPPEKYRVVYSLPSLRLDPANRPIVTNTTVVDFSLPISYPREKPYAVALGNVFHPNFGEYVCIADFWSPSQSIADIIIEVGEMLQWQKYNIQSPLNAVAANWAVKHKDALPVGHNDLLGPSKTTEVKITPLSEG